MRAGARLTRLPGVVLAVLLGSPAPPASASFVSGEVLLHVCTGKDSTWRGICLGYVMGISDTMAALPLSGQRACVPEGISNERVADAVVRYLQANASLRHRAAANLVPVALAEAYPCS